MKRKKMNNKGFTLVELIVVLVILAILAAILVPTLLGYIERARSEKDFSTAQSIRVAMQSEIAELYGKGDDDVSWEDLTKDAPKKAIFKLVGASEDGQLDGQTIELKDGLVKDNQLVFIKLTIDDKYYAYSTSTNTWVAGDEAKNLAKPSTGNSETPTN